jgi:hypothetical protein
MAVNVIPLTVLPETLLGTRTNTNFPAPKWFLARDINGNIVLVSWDATAQLLARDGENIYTVGG